MSDSFLADYPGLNDYTAADGRFELELSEEQTNAIQAEAEDHATTIEYLPAAQDDVVNLTVRLKPSSGLRARVVDAAGRPVGGASVTVVGGAVDAQTMHQAAQFKAGRFSVQWREGVVATKDDGSFSLLSPPIDGWVHAANEAGFASLPLAAVRSTGQLVLQPYGRIEGTLTVLGQPLAGEEFLLGLSPMGLQADFNLHRVTTDAQGRFVFEQVPPGNVAVVRLVKTTPTSWTHGQQTPVQVEPGQTARIAVGNAGAVVQGRARLENPPTGEEWILNGHLQTRGPKIPASFHSQAEAEAFFASPEWVEHQKTQKHYPVKVAADGSLLLDSVVPGIYTLTVNADVPGDQPWNTKTIATGVAEVTVPAESDPLVPVQVNELVVKPIPPAK